MTLGFGPALFDERFALAAMRPTALRELPAFPGDALDPAWCGGDLCVQACAHDGRRGACRAASAWQTASRCAGARRASLLRAPGDRPGDAARRARLQGRDRQPPARQGPRPPRLGRRPRALVDARRLVPRRAADPRRARGLAGAAGGRAGARDRPPPRHRCAARSRPRVRAAARGAARGRPRGAREPARQPRRGDAAPRLRLRRAASSSWPTSGTRGASSCRFSAGWPSGTRSRRTRSMSVARCSRCRRARGPAASWGRSSLTRARPAREREQRELQAADGGEQQPGRRVAGEREPEAAAAEAGDQRQVERLMGGDGEGVRAGQRQPDDEHAQRERGDEPGGLEAEHERARQQGEPEQQLEGGVDGEGDGPGHGHRVADHTPFICEPRAQPVAFRRCPGSASTPCWRSAGCFRPAPAPPRR